MAIPAVPAAAPNPAAGASARLSPQAIANAIGGSVSNGSVVASPLATSITLDPASTSGEDALTQALIQSNNAQTAAGLASQQANLGLQGQQAISNEQYQLSQLVPQLGDVAAAGDLTQAQLAQNAPLAAAKLADQLAARGTGLSGIALGAQGRLASAQGQTATTDALKTAQSEDALSRQITALQQQTAANTAGYAAQAKALGALPSTVGSSV